MSAQRQEAEAPASGVPLYQKIFVILQNKIQSGELLPGDLVATEQELCREFGVSRITARRALNELAGRGLVDRQRGRGTRVAQAAAEPVRSSIDGLFENVGHLGRTTAVRVLRNGTVPAGRAAAEALRIAPDDPVLRAVRVRLLGDTPLCYLTTSVPIDIGENIAGHDMSRTPLLLLLEEVGVPVATAQQTISAALADAEVADALNVAAGAPLIDVRRVVFDTSDRAVEHITILYRPELYQFEMKMQREAGKNGREWRSKDQLRIAGPDSGQ